MVKLKDILNGPHRFSFMFLAVITIGFFIKILFLGESNLVNLVKVKFELMHQKDEIERYHILREIPRADSSGNTTAETSWIIFSFRYDDDPYPSK